MPDVMSHCPRAYSARGPLKWWGCRVSHTHTHTTIALHILSHTLLLSRNAYSIYLPYTTDAADAVAAFQATSAYDHGNFKLLQDLLSLAKPQELDLETMFSVSNMRLRLAAWWAACVLCCWLAACDGNL